MTRVALVTGGSSGLGQNIKERLRGDGWHVFNVDLRPDMADALDAEYGTYFLEADLAVASDAQWCFAAVEQRLADEGIPATPVSLLINCAGVNHIQWLDRLEVEDWDKVMNVNARAHYLMVRAFLPNLIATQGTVCNIISNASHMPMTASAAYNASKGAAEILTRQMARELAPHKVTVFGVSPNKMAGTGMSQYIESRVPEVRGWTKDYAHEYQIKSLLAGAETPVDCVGEFVAWLCTDKNRNQFLTGCVLPYGA